MNVLSVASLAAAVIAWISYMPVAKIPGVRRTMWPTWAIFVISMWLALAAFATKPDAYAIAGLALFGLFIVSFFLFLKLPGGAGRPQAGQTIPHFEVKAENGQTLSADDYTGKGPLLLVFFRGFW
jgi:hypothetical protein